MKKLQSYREFVLERRTSKEAPSFSVNEALILEGGAAGHMSHPFDNKELTLADREFSCSCGNLMDRDLNAAKNLEELFCTESSSGNYACVQDGNVFAYYAPSQPAWVNQEASPMTVRL